MERLVQVIESIRARLPDLKARNLKETPTRTIVIDPLLEALGWDVRNPDQVELEYPTLDGKSVDYALKLAGPRPALLIEAKALDDRLDDVKAVTQVVGYASNNGIVWCILTNGVVWRVYRSIENCPAPDKLMFEVRLDGNESPTIATRQIAEEMWSFSRQGMEQQRLDTLSERRFTDGKIRKALVDLMTTVPRPFQTALRTALGDQDLSLQRIRGSLERLANELVTGSVSRGPSSPVVEGRSPSAGYPTDHRPGQSGEPPAAPDRKAKASKRTHKDTKTGSIRRAKKGESTYDEQHHTRGRSEQVVGLWRLLDRLSMSFAASGIARRYLAKSVNYEKGTRPFCSVHLLKQGGLRVWLQLKYDGLQNPPSFARDVSNVGHWGAGDLELCIASQTELEQAEELIRRSFEKVR